jgi:hypothetical protein
MAFSASKTDETVFGKNGHDGHIYQYRRSTGGRSTPAFTSAKRYSCSAAVRLSLPMPLQSMKPFPVPDLR